MNIDLIFQWKRKTDDIIKISKTKIPKMRIYYIETQNRRQSSAKKAGETYFNSETNSWWKLTMLQS